MAASSNEKKRVEKPAGRKINKERDALAVVGCNCKMLDAAAIAVIFDVIFSSLTQSKSTKLI